MRETNINILKEFAGDEPAIEPANFWVACDRARSALERNRT
jgi:hypothetical protein